MNCFYCKAQMKSSYTTHFVQVGSCSVIIKNVPCMECEQCGEIVYTAAVAQRLEQIVDSLEKVFTEVAVVNYTAA